MSRALLLVLLLIIAPAWGTTLTPGDRVYLQLPGESAFDDPFTIDDQGQLRLPEAGLITVAGLSIDEAEQRIRKRLSTIYRNLDELELSIMEHLIRIQVLGYVEQPGMVSLKPGSNIQMAVAEAGGARPGAQLDQFKLIRNSKTQVFNYKQYLDSGDPGQLPAIKSGDTIFVPASPLLGNIEVNFDAASLREGGDADEEQGITIFGELRNPGTFSFKPDMTVVDALMRADGVTRYADVTKIRVITDNIPYQFDLKAYLDTGDASNLPPIKPGTTIFAPIEVEDINTTSRTVYVMGEVKAPGAYESSPGTGFIDVLANAGGPTRFADTTHIKLLSNVNAPLSINLVEYTRAPGQNTLPPIEPGDVIFVPEKIDFNEKSWLKVTNDRAIKIIGAINNPGRFEWSDSMSFMDLLAHAGGPKQQANLSNIRIIRESAAKNEPRVTFFDFVEFTKAGQPKGKLPQLRAGDTVIMDELPHDPTDNKSSWLRQSARDSIYIFGQVGAPGRYAFNNEQGFLDILSAADGPTGEADIQEVLISHRSGKDTEVTRFNLSHYFETGNESLIPDVAPGDVIYIPQLEKAADERAVKVIGAVNAPGRFKWNDTMTFLDILAMAGGPKQQANISNIRLIKEQQNTPENVIYFDLENFINEGGNFAALPLLEAGDTIVIDELPHDPTDNKASWIRQSADDSIYVFGQVGAPGRYAFNRELGFLDILSAADGPNGDADLRQIRISHRDKSQAQVTKLNLSLYFETGDESLLPVVVPGDVIYVPKEQGNWLDKPAERVVRLMGSVNKPGRYTFNNQMNILDLLAEAGGPSDEAYIERIMIVNTSCCGDQAQTFNLRDYVIDPARYPLPLLRPGDTVYVPNESDSIGEQWRQGLRDVLGLFTLIALGAAL
ncbi:SLBB domain-containing protein [Photobacterium sp. OFAV2-7]|uniref:SLBB domain-containing protein n=1 Tax=Photobacterium sp. OFAV2-7 TaxID=2917748 RepID=UPI001EF686BF|nr:SLBB domain-containing protein [Photobacterium sp. OFAV2-7]MCG7584541.1 SLBB domain-containing protein [Photobacterium sp. OFAV2-7]